MLSSAWASATPKWVVLWPLTKQEFEKIQAYAHSKSLLVGELATKMLAEAAGINLPYYLTKS
jgi:hypothetical protein